MSVLALFLLVVVPLLGFDLLVLKRQANAFGLLTLRSLYFLLRESMGRFIYLHVGVGVILVFSAIKLGASDFLAVPWWATLAFIVAVLSVTKIAALLKTSDRGGPGRRPSPPPPRDLS